MRLFFHKSSFLFGALAASFCGAASTPARAEDHPRLSPMRDVVVTYRFQTVAAQQSDPARMHDVTVYFAGSGDRLRIDSGDGRAVTILDRPAQKVTLLMMKERLYTQLMPQFGLRNPFLLDLTMHYKPKEPGNVAGVPCRNWAIDTAHGKAAACVTDDGVILSESGVDADGVSGSLEAVKVSYQDIPASLFQPPEGFEKIEPAHPMPRRNRRGGDPAPVPNAPESGDGTLLPGQAVPAQPDTTQPPVANDSGSDGTIRHADQPSSGMAGSNGSSVP